MNKSFSRYLPFLLALLVMLAAGAGWTYASPLYKTRSYGIRDGLTSQHISTITQDKNDILWVATWNGVAYFDGYKFTNFRGNSVNGQLSSNRFNDMLHDRNGNVWLLSFDRDIILLDVATAHFRNMRSILPAGIANKFTAKGLANVGDYIWIIGAHGSPSARINVTGEINGNAVEIIDIDDIFKGADEIRKIMSGGNGREWIFTDKGLRLFGSDVALPGQFIDVYDPGDAPAYIIAADGNLFTYTPSDGVKQASTTASPESVYTSIPYNDSTILIGGSKGITALNTATGKASILPSPTNSPVNEINVDSRGRIWAFSTDGNVTLYNSVNEPGRLLSVAPGKGTTSIIDIWLEDRFGNVWLAPAGGSFCLYDETDGTFKPQIIKHNEYSAESVAPIETAYVDNQNNLWFSSNHNLTAVSFHNEDFRHATLTENDEVRAIGRLNDGSILLGTAAGHLARFDRDGRLVSFLSKSGGNGTERLTESHYKTPFSSKIYTIVEDKDRNVWIGTKGAGLHAISPSGTVTTFRHNPADPYSLPCDTVYHLNQDKQGNLWIATYGAGLALAKPQPDGSVKFISSRNELKSYPRGVHDRIRRITSTPDGDIIASCTSGLLTFSNKFTNPADIKFHVSRHIPGDSTSLAGDNVMQTLIASDGSIYVLPMGERIQKLKSTDLQQDNLEFETPYSGNNPHSILYSTGKFGNSMSLVEDTGHNIIIVFEANIVVYDPETGNAYSLASKSMGDDVEFTEALPALDPATGRLWFATLGSGLIVSPDNVKTGTYVPRIAFTGIHFQSEKETRSLINPSDIIVPPGERNIAISFAALDYPDNSNIQYAYRMEGQPDWTYIDNTNTIYLNDLTPGIHRLYVRSTNAEGIWQDNAKSLDLIIKPTFAESVWARLLYLIIALIILFTIIYIYTIYRKSQIMKELHRKERTFFIEASHRLRTPLTLIGSPVAEVLETEQLSETGRQHLTRVHRNALEMLQLVNSMLKRDFDDTDSIDDENAAAYITPGSTATSFYDGSTPVVAEETSDNEADTPAEEHTDRTTILIVEDNKDLREFLRDILRLQYNVVTANNGRDGLLKAEKVQPDFIITDVTMPEMDGLTMVHNIKQNKSLSHIPIIVLSAKASVNDRIQGLREGIDDYITKPFSATYLRQRIASIITQRSILQQSYFERLGREMAEIGSANIETEQPPVAPVLETPDDAPDKSAADYHLDAPSITDADQEMMDRLLKYIETRIGDENLKIEELADAVNMGRTVFYGKIKALVGMSPSDFVRRLRMQRAEELIVRSKMNFSQIAYNVGFSDPKYFTKCFKKETGMTPSEYRQKSAV